MPNTTKIIVRAGLIAGLYVVLSLLTLPVASGAIQFRLSEALTILPLFFIEAVPALFVGCMLSNLISGCMLLDIILGSVITLVSAILTYITGKLVKSTLLKVLIGGFFPVILNAFFLPVLWIVIYGAIEYVYMIQVLFLLISQSISIYGFGTPLYLAVKKNMEKNNIK
ncbi:MAG: QueT transporter family protein [Clostridiales bacterium]|nr:QueT transporter family protein [Clostridiales bacterium]